MTYIPNIISENYHKPSNRGQGIFAGVENMPKYMANDVQKIYLNSVSDVSFYMTFRPRVNTKIEYIELYARNSRNANASGANPITCQFGELNETTGQFITTPSKAITVYTPTSSTFTKMIMQIDSLNLKSGAYYGAAFQPGTTGADGSVELLGRNIGTTGSSSVSGLTVTTTLYAQTGVTASASNETFTKSGHAFNNNDAVTLSSITPSTGTGLSASTTYYIINSDKVNGTFKLSTTQGGASVNVLANVTSVTVTANYANASATLNATTGLAASTDYYISTATTIPENSFITFSTESTLSTSITLNSISGVTAGSNISANINLAGKYVNGFNSDITPDMLSAGSGGITRYDFIPYAMIRDVI